MLLSLAGLLSACDRFDTAHHEVLASNSKWTLTALGDLAVPGPSFGVNLVRFEARRFGADYAAGALYEAGPHDRSFKNRYNHIEWASPDALRLWSPPQGTPTSIRLNIRNDAEATIRWLRVRVTDLLLVLEMLPGASLSLTTTHGEYPDISLQGKFDEGSSIEKYASIGYNARDVNISVATTSVMVDVIR